MALATAGGGAGRTAPLRVDAQRNLEHVLRAAREVFGELGYGAPMEDVARRARVGVGTVYRRFPSKDVLVRRIADEETHRLTEQAHASLVQEEDPWAALARFLRYAVSSGAGRLLPPAVLRAGAAEVTELSAAGRLPQQRQDPAPASDEVVPGDQAPGVTGPAGGASPSVQVRSAADEAGAAGLLDAVAQLVERARRVGALRPDVTVADILLVIATAAPTLPDAAQQAAASGRVLEILLAGLRAGGAGASSTADTASVMVQPRESAPYE